MIIDVVSNATPPIWAESGLEYGQTAFFPSRSDQDVDHDARLENAVAIVANSCRLPGADGPEIFWQRLLDGFSPIRQVPENCLDPELYYDPRPGKIGKSYTRLAAIFDRERLWKEIGNYPYPENFRCDDPLLKLAYIVAGETLAQASFPRPEPSVGVYLGALRASDLSNDYIVSTTAPALLESLETLPEFASLDENVRAEILRRSIRQSQHLFRHENLWGKGPPEIRLGDFVTNLSDVFGWTGPAYSLDAACTSSLVALDCARSDLLSGRIKGALVGAVSSMTSLSFLIFSNSMAASATMSRPFDAQADGVVGAMGIVFMFLKTYRQALRDGDKILGLIRGIGFSSDGHGKGMWAPKPEGQLLALQRAYKEPKLAPKRLNYLEAHATSTGVGDATELKMLETFLSGATGKTDEDPDADPSGLMDDKLVVGSVKANFGHCFEASGFVSLMKVLQIIKHERIPSQINISRLHPELINRELPFRVPLGENRPFPVGEKPRLFGINAFGIGGLNSHLVLEEHFEDRSSSYAYESSDRRPVNRTEPVAVLGMGCVYPGAFSAGDFWQLMLDAADPKTRLSEEERAKRYFSRSEISENDLRGGYIENYQYDWSRHRIPPLQIRRCDPLQTFVMGAVDEALTDRSLSGNECENAFVVAGSDHLTNFYHEYLTVSRVPEIARIVRDSAAPVLRLSGSDANDAEVLAARFAAKVLKEHSCISDVTGSFCSSSLPTRITKIYDLHGGAFTIDGGGTSSSSALDYSVRRLQDGKAALGICVGAYRWTNSHAVRHYAARYGKDMLPLAEGAGALVLKPYSQLGPEESSAGMILATRRVVGAKIDVSDWERFGLAPEDLAVVSISSPSTGKHLNLLAEQLRRTGRKQTVPVTRCRDQLGNLCAASGIAETVKTLLMLKNRLVPRQLPWNEPIDDLFFVPDTAVSLDKTERLFALVLDLDEQGNGYAAVLAPASFGPAGETAKTDLPPRPVVHPLPPDGLHEKSDIVPVYRKIGTPYEMGFGLGFAEATKIARLMELYEKPSSTERSVFIDAESLLPRAAELFGEEGVDELRGLADGSGIPFEDLFFHNVRFYAGLAGSRFTVEKAASSGRPFRLACIYRSPLRERFGPDFDVYLCDCEPSGAPAYKTLSATGCIGGFVGINSNGIAFSLLPAPMIADRANAVVGIPAPNRLAGLKTTANIDQHVLPGAGLLLTDLATGRSGNLNGAETLHWDEAVSRLRRESTKDGHLCSVVLDTETPWRFF